MLSNRSRENLVPYSPRARRYLRQIRKRYQDYLHEVKRVPLAVLVWGPSRECSDMFAKRVEIVNSLRKDNVVAFSSDLDPLIVAGSDAIPLKAHEYLEGLSVDLIVVIHHSFGSVAEVHGILSCKELTEKALVFVEEKTLEGFATKVTLEEMGEHVRTFSYPDDIASCKLKDNVLAWVNKMKHIKYRLLREANKWGTIR